MACILNWFCNVACFSRFAALSNAFVFVWSDWSRPTNLSRSRSVWMCDYERIQCLSGISALVSRRWILNFHLQFSYICLIVNETYDAETETEWQYRDETETLVPPVRDDTETLEPQDRDIGVTVSRRDWDISATSPRRYRDETFKTTTRDVRSRCLSRVTTNSIV